MEVLNEKRVLDRETKNNVPYTSFMITVFVLTACLVAVEFREQEKAG